MHLFSVPIVAVYARVLIQRVLTMTADFRANSRGSLTAAQI